MDDIRGHHRNHDHQGINDHCGGLNPTVSCELFSPRQDETNVEHNRCDEYQHKGEIGAKRGFGSKKTGRSQKICHGTTMDNYGI
jgi:hypothetical protein